MAISVRRSNLREEDQNRCSASLWVGHLVSSPEMSEASASRRTERLLVAVSQEVKATRSSVRLRMVAVVGKKVYSRRRFVGGYTPSRILIGTLASDDRGARLSLS